MKLSRRMLVLLLVALVLAAGTSYLVSRDRGAPNASPPGTGSSTAREECINVSSSRRAIIYDSLYREYPDEELLSRLKKILEAHGYVVDVYAGVNATLDPLVSLDRYGVIVIRAHGAYNGRDESRPLGSYIYTGLHYGEAKQLYGEWLDDALESGDLALGVIPPPGSRVTEELVRRLPKYVVVSPRFFEKNLGGLNGSIVVFAGCYGFDDDRLANVFIGKGAYAYVSWRGNVTWPYLDSVLDDAVSLLLKGGDPRVLEEDVPPDPVTGNGVLVAVNPDACVEG